MSVQNIKSPDEWTRTTFGGRPPPCFFCGTNVIDVVVVWSGQGQLEANDGLVILHPVCATILGGELIADARNAERLLHGKPILAGICKSLVAEGEA